MTTPATKRLFDNLARAGLKPDYVRRFLPQWMSDGALDDASVLPELKLAIARRFGLDTRALLSEASEVRLRTPAPARYKRSKRAREADLDVATAVAVSAARMAAVAVRTPYEAPPKSGIELHALIRDRYKPRFLSLRVVLRYAWDTGIPVLFVVDLPEGAPKMDALTVCHGGRPAIVVSKSVPFSAWLSFILCHELGHIAQGHLAEEDLLVDSEISGESYLLEDDDAEERAADAFAIELLNGAPDRRYDAERRFNANELAHAAMEIQRANGIDAGHVILNYGHGSKRWDVAIAALQIIDKQDARGLFQAAFREQIATDALPRDSVDFLMRIAGGA